MDYGFIAFSSTYAAIAAQKLLKEAEVPFQVMPVPREVSASCGIALRLTPERLGPAAEVLEGSALDRALYVFYRAGASGCEAV